MGNRYKFSVDVSATNSKVSGSCIPVRVHRPEGNIQFLVDVGLHQGEDDCELNNRAQFKFKPENVEFVLLTHVHADHSGRLPLLFKRGANAIVYCSFDTGAMLPIALKDDEKVMSLNAKKHNTKPLYTPVDIENTLYNTSLCKYGKTFKVAEGIYVTFFKNAHLVGAAMILVQIKSCGYEDINLLFTGDYRKHNVFFDVSELPEWVRNMPLHIVCESTYGSVTSKVTDVPVFIQNIGNALKEGINAILIPALSLGRYQEIAYMLKCAQEDGIIDANIPIYFDGNLAIKYNNVFKYKLDIHPQMKNFMPRNFYYVEDNQREAVINSKKQRIIVTTSGMGNFGPAPEYIAHLIERENVMIHFTSFLSADSIGTTLVNASAGEYVSVSGVLKKMRAKVYTTSEFSGHAKRDELLEFLEQFKNLRSVLINHGEPDSKRIFAEACKNTFGTSKDVAILGNGFTFRLDTYGIVKSIWEK